MTKIKAVIKEQVPNHVEIFDFHLVDDKGRRLGAKVYTRRVEFVAAPENRSYYWRERLGEAFCFTPCSTRDGKGFGASQHEQFFDTEDERDVAVSRYLTRSMKTAAKKFKPVEA